MSRFSTLAQIFGVLFWLATASYALLASQTFAYEQFLRPQLSAPVAWFARHHLTVAVALLALYVTSRRPDAASRGSRLSVIVAACAWMLAIGGLFLVPLRSVGPGAGAHAIIGAALALVVLLATVDIASAEPIQGTPESRHASDFVACAGSAAAAATISAAIGLGRGAGVTLASLSGLVTSVLLHLVVFAALFLLLTAARSVAAIAVSRRVEVALMFWLFAVGVFLFLSRSVLPPLVGDRQTMYATAAAFAFAVSSATVARGLHASHPDDDSVRRVLGAFSPRGPRWMCLCRGLLLTAGAAVAIAKVSGASDWNFIIADVGVALTWVLAFATFARVVDVRNSGNSLTLIATTGVIVALNAGWARADFQPTTVPADAPNSGVQRWSSLDPAARFLAERFNAPAASADGTLLDLLRRHTNVPATVDVAPVAVSFGRTETVAAYRPHVFLIVVDSLRRDYLGLYNPAVTFTPALDAFGREGVAFDRPFTRYGATGLAIPSIWTGGMLLHKQYVVPFAPMNALARLLADQGYDQWIGMDNIMEAILPPSDRREPLDASRMVKDFRLCRTLSEVRSRLGRRRPGDAPVFAYTLPQDIHVSSITREGRRVIDAANYEGFDAPVASRVRALDRCFGEFIAELKARNLYDDSVVIVTSDHGDSLGEGGRMGHAYTLFPEIVQVPLLVHLPARLASLLEAENESYVFTTDITPTLHALLGLDSTPAAPFFGRPLFRRRGSPPRAPEIRPPVLAASYGAVYGALLDRGETLYILDAVNLREYAFALDGTGAGAARATSDEIRAAGHAAVREAVEEIAAFYRFAPSRGTARLHPSAPVPRALFALSTAMEPPLSRAAAAPGNRRMPAKPSILSDARTPKSQRSAR